MGPHPLFECLIHIRTTIPSRLTFACLTITFYTPSGRVTLISRPTMHASVFIYTYAWTCADPNLYVQRAKHAHARCAGPYTYAACILSVRDAGHPFHQAHAYYLFIC